MQILITPTVTYEIGHMVQAIAEETILASDIEFNSVTPVIEKGEYKVKKVTEDGKSFNEEIVSKVVHAAAVRVTNHQDPIPDHDVGLVVNPFSALSLIGELSATSTPSFPIIIGLPATITL